MKINIKTLTNQKYTVECENNQTVLDIKNQLESMIDNDHTVSRLIHMGKILNDDQTIESLGIKENDFIVAMNKKKTMNKKNENAPATGGSVGRPSSDPSNPSSQMALDPPVTTPSEAALINQVPSVPATTPVLIPETANVPVERSLFEQDNSHNQINFAQAILQNPQFAMFMSQISSDPRVATGVITQHLHNHPERLSSLIPEDIKREMVNKVLESELDDEFATAILLSYINKNPQNILNLTNQEQMQGMVMRIMQENPDILNQLFNPEGIDFERENALPSANVPDTISPEDQENINMLMGICDGFPLDMIKEAYFACDRNVELAANFLFSNQ